MTREDLSEEFEYDAWANALWGPVVAKMGPDSRFAEIFAHMLSCHKVWYGRTLSPEEMPETSENPIEALPEMAHHWIALVKMSDPSAFVSFTRKTGETVYMMVEDVARQVIFHGAYHRGELRSLAEQAGVEWPETDFALWKMTTSSVH